MNGDVSIADCNQRDYDDGKIDKTGNPVIKPKAYFDKLGDWIDFDNVGGELSAQTEYECYTINLTAAETKQLFLSMMNFYKAKGDLFWESNERGESHGR